MEYDKLILTCLQNTFGFNDFNLLDYRFHIERFVSYACTGILLPNRRTTLQESLGLSVIQAQFDVADTELSDAELQ